MVVLLLSQGGTGIRTLAGVRALRWKCGGAVSTPDGGTLDRRIIIRWDVYGGSGSAGPRNAFGPRCPAPGRRKLHGGTIRAAVTYRPYELSLDRERRPRRVHAWKVARRGQCREPGIVSHAPGATGHRTSSMLAAVGHRGLGDLQSRDFYSARFADRSHPNGLGSWNAGVQMTRCPQGAMRVEACIDCALKVAKPNRNTDPNRSPVPASTPPSAATPVPAAPTRLPLPRLPARATVPTSAR